MTLQYAKELLLMELAQVIDNKNKKIEEQSTEISMLSYRVSSLESELLRRDDKEKTATAQEIENWANAHKNPANEEE